MAISAKCSYFKDLEFFLRIARNQFPCFCDSCMCFVAIVMVGYSLQLKPFESPRYFPFDLSGFISQETIYNVSELCTQWN